MRRFALICVLLLFFGRVQGQSPLTDCFQLLRPELRISVFRDFAATPTAHACTGGSNLPTSYGAAFECESWSPDFKSIGSGNDATGAFYQITPNFQLGTTDIVRGTDTTTEPIARTGVANVVNLAVDTTNGRVYLAERVTENTCGNSVAVEGIVVISGLPTMFETLLTFVPNGQTLTALTPAIPDGFRSADSLQAWTGSLRTLPDWSQAQPLTCSAATSPAPGQIATVADSLSDPAVDEGRYYIVASQRGTDRRIGRQYVNGTFSARDPSTLPVCQ